MAKSKNQQEAHGIGQVEDQLNNQAQAAEQMQGLNAVDQSVQEAAQNMHSESLDEVMERETT
ncbi:hypothetical protein [Paenibacillus aestuarii]|uniref:DUF4025 domain-containing protein n=1 Tax=Paenibacillus aestuarii TaxID=516965 RepID=A0ABW0K3J2_9BACL|nr:hypothetical protein [Paenibacillus aestuarii]